MEGNASLYLRLGCDKLSRPEQHIPQRMVGLHEQSRIARTLSQAEHLLRQLAGSL